MWKQTHCEVCGSSESDPVIRIPDFVSYEPVVARDTQFSIVTCSDCAHRYVVERLSREELTTIYSSGAYKAFGTYGDPKNAKKLVLAGEIFVEDIQRHIDFRSGMTLFEVGSSFGHLLDAARTSGFQVRGVELSASALQYARDHFGLDVQSAAIEEAAIEGGPFDVVVSISVLEHVYDLSETMDAMRAIMHKDTLLYVEVPVFDPIGYKLRSKRHIQRLIDRKSGIYHPVEHIRYFTAESMHRWLSRYFHTVRQVPDPRWKRYYPYKFSTDLLSRIFRCDKTGSIVFTASGPK